jgi:predicted RNA-binding protein
LKKYVNGRRKIEDIIKALCSCEEQQVMEGLKREFKGRVKHIDRAG